MTSKAATRVHLNDRGILRPGMIADITIFDPATIHDVSTFEDPKHYSVGVRHVLVNGHRAVTDGAITNERAGRALRGPGYKQVTEPKSQQSRVNSRERTSDFRLLTLDY
jgi:N-acyl-D-aspartate/D-glutamate deacylase